MTIESIQAIIIKKEIPTDGHSPLLIVGSDFRKYIAKNNKGHEPPVTLINETLAAFFLKNWDLPVPDFKMIYFNNKLLKSKDLSINHKPYFYENPAFGSAYVETAIELNDYVFSSKKAFYKRIINPAEFFRIALFDIWIENDDRKPSNYNLLFSFEQGKYRIIPIDHAFIFSTLAHRDLNASEFFPVDNEHLLVSDFGRFMKKYKDIDEAFLEKEKHYFYFCVNKCRQLFDDYIVQLQTFINIPDESVAKIKEFLFDKERNKKVFNEFIYRLNQ